MKHLAKVFGLLLLLPLFAAAQDFPRLDVASKDYSDSWAELNNELVQEDHNILFADRIPLQFPKPHCTAELWPDPNANNIEDTAPPILVTMAVE